MDQYCYRYQSTCTCESEYFCHLWWQDRGPECQTICIIMDFKYFFCQLSYQRKYELVLVRSPEVGWVLASFPSCFPQMSVSDGPHPDFQFPTPAHGRHQTCTFIKASCTRDFSIRPHHPTWDLSLFVSLSHSPSPTYVLLSLHLLALPVPNCPPSHLSCDVYGPFCFCVLMTTVTERQPLPMRPDERCYPDARLTPLCPWPQRRWPDREGEEWDRWWWGCTWGMQGWGPVRHPATGRWKPSPCPPPSCHHPSTRPVETWGWSAAMMLSLIPMAVNSALAFHRNIYLHPNRRSEGPSPALQRPRKAPQRVNVPMMDGAAHDFICQADVRVLVFDVLFKCLWLTKVP